MIRRLVSFDYHGTSAFSKDIFNKTYHKTLKQEPFNLDDPSMTADADYVVENLSNTEQNLEILTK